MAPAGGSDSPPELIYGLHAVREALRAGSRPLQRLLMLRTDRQFADLVASGEGAASPRSHRTSSRLRSIGAWRNITRA